MSIFNLSNAQRRRATDFKRKVGALEEELAVVLGHTVDVAAAAVTTAKVMVPDRKARRRMAATGMKRISAIKRAGWSEFKKQVATVAGRPEPKRKTARSAKA